MRQSGHLFLKLSFVSYCWKIISLIEIFSSSVQREGLNSFVNFKNGIYENINFIFMHFFIKKN